ncbi:MAG: TIGR03435 family protein [Candidatus Sulfopaludibacter sp.]|nr:TIGR03435 family protein [Candidatus Sulfopaludibacter sp.]
MRATILYAGAIALAACCALAQTPAFEVASIKPNYSGRNGSDSDDHEGVLTANNLSLKRLIMRAYQVRDYQVMGPDWLDSERFDIAAKPPSAADSEQLNLMLQSMLVDRFKLAVHHDTKVFPVYGLLVAKGGLKVKEVEDTGNHDNRGKRGQFIGLQCSMARFAEQMGRNMDRPVLDMTGRKGVFNLTLNWMPEEAQVAKEESRADVQTYPPLLTALQEQLGLKLEPKKAPLDVLVIDHVERVPTEN